MSDTINGQDAFDAINTLDKFGIDERSRIVRWYEGLEPYVKLRDVVLAIGNLPSADTANRVFEAIVVEYPSVSTYKEYEGKPYFSIKYIEDRQKYIGYGTYNPEVLSEYLRKYFVPSAERVGHWIDTGSGQECSVCREIQYGYDTGRHYCPNCGARMVSK